jgi:proteasome assembly chaperone 4
MLPRHARGCGRGNCERAANRYLLIASTMTAIRVETRYIAPSGVSAPALALQVTCLEDSYMLWIGATEEAEENAGRATVRGHLGKDWAVAMPPWKVRIYF